MTDGPRRFLSEALVVWAGLGRSAWPSRDDRLVREQFGDDVATMLLPLIRELEEDFYSSSARFSATELSEMGESAASEFRGRHPEITEEAVRALAWCYTFDYK